MKKFYAILLLLGMFSLLSCSNEKVVNPDEDNDPGGEDDKTFAVFIVDSSDNIWL